MTKILFPHRLQLVGVVLVMLSIDCISRKSNCELVAHPPSELLIVLKGAVTSNGWNKIGGGPIDVRHYLTLNDGVLLFFLQIPNYIGGQSNAAVPVTVDLHGKWKWGAPLKGAITNSVIATDGSIWVSSEWIIEGTFPIIYRSADGVDWREIELPPDRTTTGPSETLDTLCVDSLQVEIQLEREKEDGSRQQQIWMRPTSSLGNWSLKDKISNRCAQGEAHSLCLRDDSNTNEFLFHCGRFSVYIPKSLNP